MDNQKDKTTESCNIKKLSCNVMKRIELREIKNWRLRMKIYALLALAAIIGFIPGANYLRPVIQETQIEQYTKTIIDEGRDYGSTVISNVETSPIPAIIILACLAIISMLAVKQFLYCRTNAHKFTKNFLARKSQPE